MFHLFSGILFIEIPGFSYGTPCPGMEPLMKKILVIVTILCMVVQAALFARQVEVEISYSEIDDGGYSLVAANSGFIPVWVELDFPSLDNLQPSRELPVRLVIQPGDENVPVVDITPITNESYSFSYSYLYGEGDPWSTEHDDDYLYLLPYQHGTKHRVGQGFQGAFTHMGHNEFAIDFDMDTGTPILAARAGIVSSVKEDSRVGGVGQYYADKGNYVMVYHDDGTFANYVHLRFNGAAVQPGDRVKQGDLIGYSGNTGMSSGPHLHFDVRIPLPDGQMQSIPVSFLGMEQEAFVPQEGIYYYAFHPGGEPFEAVLGSEITNGMYDDYSVPFSGKEKITFRDERIDDTILLFIQNGFSEAKTVSLEFTLTNLTMSRPNPWEITVPAGTEIFLLYLNGIDPSNSSKYSWSYSIK
jgi:murein DD-endopeptidase MepM/ murein hydrolase activator NlpD